MDMEVVNHRLARARLPAAHGALLPWTSAGLKVRQVLDFHSLDARWERRRWRYSALKKTFLLYVGIGYE
jgi:hypothetical protein